MAKKKAAPSKVVAKKDLKKSKTKKTRAAKHKTGRKWFKPEQPMFPDGTLLAKVIDQFNKADNNVIGENDLIAALEKGGLKADGKKTPKKQVKAVLRNLSRSGLIIKDRGREKDKGKTKDEDVEADEEDEEDDDEEVDTPAADEEEVELDEDEAEDDEAEDDDDDEAEDEEPVAKKKVIAKKAAAPKKPVKGGTKKK